MSPRLETKNGRSLESFFFKYNIAGNFSDIRQQRLEVTEGFASKFNQNGVTGNSPSFTPSHADACT
jgi:hypothetical protein